MSDMTLTTTTATTNQYDYMVNINPSIVQKNDSPTMNTSPPVSYDESAQQYAYHDYAFQPMPLSYPTVYPMTYYDPQQQQQQQQQQRLISSTTTQLHPNSPDSISSSSSPPTPPSTLSTMHRSNTVPIMNSSNNNNNGQILTTTTSQIMDPMSSPSPMMNPLMTTSTSTSSSSSNSSNSSTSTFSNATTARVKETIARANSVPMEFYHTEFLEYSKETYERKMDAKRNKRKRSSPMKASNDTNEDEKEDGINQQQKKKKRDNSNMDQNDSLSFDNKNDSDEDDFDEDDDKMENRELSSAELRRQIHIQSEQKRRAQIKDGFDELRKYLPGCNNKKMSKAALLTRTVQQIQHMKKVQTELLSEVERLVQENDNLKKFQHNVLQRQAMEKMYSF